jgi:uncharacterized Zn finger protein
MSDSVERVAADCPACSPPETVHELLAEGGGHLTVRCTECGHTHKIAPEREASVQKRVIVSQEGESVATQVEAPPTEEIAVGEEFIVDTEEALLTVRITSLQLGNERRTDRARVEDVETIWTRAVDNVAVPVTVNPTDGRHDDTRSLELRVPGDEQLGVGERRAAGEESFTIKGIHLREDAVGYEFGKLDHEGDSAAAKDVKRLYADDDGDGDTTAWSVW